MAKRTSYIIFIAFHIEIHEKSFTYVEECIETQREKREWYQVFTNFINREMDVLQARNTPDKKLVYCKLVVRGGGGRGSGAYAENTENVNIWRRKC